MSLVQILLCMYSDLVELLDEQTVYKHLDVTAFGLHCFVRDTNKSKISLFPYLSVCTSSSEL